MRLIAQFLKHVVPGVAKPLMILWNEIIGFIFVCLSVFVGMATYRRLEHFNKDIGGILILTGQFVFALVLALYGVSSFRKARKISRSPGGSLNQRG